MKDDTILELQNVSRIYRRKSGKDVQIVQAAHEVNFKLQRQRVLAIVGESGSGKTTIARLVTGVEKPTSGTVLFEAKAVQTKNRRALFEYHRAVQMVFQDPYASINPLKTIEYTLTRPLVNYLGLSPKAAESRVREAMETVHLTPVDEFIRKLPFELSGGQLQRVVIARALAPEPRLIVADEPVSMLDVSIRAEILSLLGELRSKKGVSFLYITHDLISARALADDILVLYRGHVVEQGNARVVARDPKHPYTQLLLRSIPNPWQEDQEKSPAAESIERATVSVPAQGCVFQARCPFVMDKCLDGEPSLRELGDGRSVACFLHHKETVETGGHA